MIFPITTRRSGIIRGTEYRNAPAVLETPRGATPQIGAVMRKHSIPPTTEDTSESAILKVPTSGKLAESVDFVDVIVDSNLLKQLEDFDWRATSTFKKIPPIRVVARHDNWNRAVGWIVWLLVHRQRASQISYVNNNYLDARIANIKPRGRVVDVDPAPELVNQRVKIRDQVGRLNASKQELVEDAKRDNLLEEAQERAREIDPTIPLIAAPIKIRSQLRRRGSLSSYIRDHILERDGGICFYCEYEADQVDHIIPYSYGGTDDESNLIACCSICNGIASDNVFSTLQEKRDYVRSRYGPYMERRYRRFLHENSVCADCEELYNPAAPGASNLLCADCYAAS